MNTQSVGCDLLSTTELKEPYQGFYHLTEKAHSYLTALFSSILSDATRGFLELQQ